MKVLHKRNQGKSLRNEGGYGGEVGHKMSGKSDFQDSSGMTLGGLWMKRGHFQRNFL